MNVRKQTVFLGLFLILALAMPCFGQQGSPDRDDFGLYSAGLGNGSNGGVFSPSVSLSGSYYHCGKSDRAWSMFQCDPRNHGQCGVEGPGSNQIRWMTVAHGTTRSSSPIVYENYVYALDGFNGLVDRFDRESGAYTDSFDLGAGAAMSPAVGHGNLYAGNDDGELIAFDLITRNPRWTFSGSVADSIPSPTLASEVVYFAHDRFVYAYDVYDGTELWKFETGDYYGTDQTGHIWMNPNSGGQVYSSPAVSPEGLVIFGSVDEYDNPPHGEIFAVEDPAVGFPEYGLKWRHMLDENEYAKGSATISEDAVFIGSDLGILYALDIDGDDNGYDQDLNGVRDDEGKILWTYDAGDSIESTCALSQGSLVFTTYGGSLVCLDSDDGGLIWKRTMAAAEFHDNSPVIAGQKIYVGSANPNVHEFYCFSLADGDLLWTYNWSNEYTNSASTANGEVFAMTALGAIQVFGD